MQIELAERIAEARFMARMAGLRSMDVALGPLATVPVRVGKIDIALDRFQAHQVARKFGNDWAEKAAHKAALGMENPIGAASDAMLHRVQIVADIESSDAWNKAREQTAAEVELSDGVLTKTWSAAMERNTCSVCRSLDGRTILASDHWPFGDPGSVHPNCKCDDYIEVVPRWMVYSPIGA